MGEDANRIIQAVQRSALRTGARDTFQHGDPILTWGPKKKERPHGYMFLADVGRDLIVGKGRKFKRFRDNGFNTCWGGKEKMGRRYQTLNVKSVLQRRNRVDPTI